MNNNATSLRAARRRDSEDKRERARRALATMVEEAAPITFEAVRRRAGVSRSFLYADVTLKTEVSNSRDRQSTAPRAATIASMVSDASLRTDLALSRQEVAELHQELGSLRERLARSLDIEASTAEGRLCAGHVEALEARLGEMAGENACLTARVIQLESDNAGLVESLEASRVNHRRLMAELNRTSPGPPSDAKRSDR